jgi:hypothetical protein
MEQARCCEHCKIHILGPKRDGILKKDNLFLGNIFIEGKVTTATLSSARTTEPLEPGMRSLVWRQIISVYTHYVVHVYETLLS